MVKWKFTSRDIFFCQMHENEFNRNWSMKYKYDDLWYPLLELLLRKNFSDRFNFSLQFSRSARHIYIWSDNSFERDTCQFYREATPEWAIFHTIHRCNQFIEHARGRACKIDFLRGNVEVSRSKNPIGALLRKNIEHWWVGWMARA